MKITGKVFGKFRADINTDEIIPAVYLDTTSDEELARHCMEGIDTEFAQGVQKGNIIVADKNFGCGSSREHAPIAIKACGVSCVIAKSFARIFYRNCINIGLPIFECDQTDKIKEKDILEIDFQTGIIKNLSTDETYSTTLFPEFMQKLVEVGGLMEYVKQKNRL
ncbi:MAG: 3-isopropylmalate dehydratase small subunit [bacterium]|nr:3-isopropylmalate dehydratase small subunit [bacterium]